MPLSGRSIFAKRFAGFNEAEASLPRMRTATLINDVADYELQ